MKVVNETKKILHLDANTPITCTAVRVPVFVSHSEAVTVEFEKPIDVTKTREILEKAYGRIGTRAARGDAACHLYGGRQENGGTH